MLLPVHLLRHLPCIPRWIIGVYRGIEYCRVKMPYENRQPGQYSFVEVHNQHNSQRTDVKQGLGKFTEPQGETGNNHDNCSPYEGPVFSFLDIAETSEPGGIASQSQIKGHGLEELPEVPWPWKNISQKLPASFSYKVYRVPDRSRYKHYGGDLMNTTPDGESSRPSEKDFGPPAPRVVKRETGDCQDGKSDHQESMLPQFIRHHSHDLGAPIEGPDPLAQINQPVDYHQPYDNYDGDNVYATEHPAGFIEKDTPGFVYLYT